MKAVDGKSLLKVLPILGAALVALIGYQNCDQSRLSLVKNAEIASAKSDGEICAYIPSTFENFTKVLFVVDKSGSNDQTDPGAAFRMGTINQFYQKHMNNQFVQWGLVAFYNDTAEAYINEGSVAVPTFTNDIPTVNAAIARIATDPDLLSTPYRSAIGLTRAAIQRDLDAFPDQVSSYVVVFLSDGVPTDYGNPIDDPAIYADVQNLVRLARVSFSTVYYGPANPAAAARLSQMAQIGGGKFLDTNIDGRIPIDYLIGFATAEPWLIKNFYVNNLNSSPCDDGTIDADSDSDGLCDKDEIRYQTEFATDQQKVTRMNGKRFDPYNRNSFSPYMNDLLYYKYVVYGEAIPGGCAAADLVDADGDMLNACEERYLHTTTPSGPTQKWTEVMGIDTDPFNFDSDGDGFMDWFELLMTRNKSSSLDYTNVNQLFLGLRLDQIFLKHLNFRNPASSPAYDGKFQFSRVNDKGQNCYSYKQTVLPLYRVKPVTAAQVSGNADLAHGENQNVIQISFIQSPEKDPNGPGELRYNFQKVSASSNEVLLNLKVEQYRSYKVGAQARVRP